MKRRSAYTTPADDWRGLARLPFGLAVLMLLVEGVTFAALWCVSTARRAMGKERR